ncbi:MAG: hypothetical protein NTV43_09305 [Methylococcales bacterium]|nr:hypothetical protein [Methylococcales bacterium]
MIFIQRTDEPAILQTKGKAEQTALCEAYRQGGTEFEFKSNIYGHEEVKTALRKMQHDKCCFCEAKLSHISYGDVEHYRPKAAYKQADSEALTKPGYYWLAYTWDNLLLSCTLCNQQYKKNLFPLQNPTDRARSHLDNIAAEKPLLLNPTLSNPQDFIGFRSEIPYALNGNLHGKTTIAVLGLDRENLNEMRRTKLGELRILLDLVTLADQQRLDDEALQHLAKEAKQMLNNATLASAEYSAMVSALLCS